MDTLTETETPTNAGGRSVDAVPSERLSGMPVHRDINWERGDKEDDGLAVEFYFNKVNELDHCRIMFPGDDRTVHDQPVTENDKLRFPRHWDAYKNQADVYAGMHRIETAPFLDAGMVRELKLRQIHTLEQLAGMSDEQIRQSRILGLVDLRRKAQRFAEDSKATEGYDDLKAENQQMREQMEAMQETLAAIRDEGAAVKANRQAGAAKARKAKVAKAGG